MIACIAEKALKVKQQRLKKNKLIYSSLKMLKYIFEKKSKVKKVKSYYFIFICYYALNKESHK
jgi:hypothetical protein